MPCRTPRQAYTQNYGSAAALTDPGVFGYISTTPTIVVNGKTVANPCFLSTSAGGTTVGQNITYFCGDTFKVTPPTCVTYNAGAYAGTVFEVADLNDRSRIPDGSMDFDHAFNTVAFVEEQIKGPTGVPDYSNVLYEAAQWAKNEPAVRNVNYSAKLVWALAEMYGRTGKTEYLTSLMHKLQRGIFYNMMMPDANPIYVANTNQTVLFSNLSEAAQRPGRMFRRTQCFT